MATQDIGICSGFCGHTGGFLERNRMVFIPLSIFFLAGCIRTTPTYEIRTEELSRVRYCYYYTDPNLLSIGLVGIQGECSNIDFDLFYQDAYFEFCFGAGEYGGYGNITYDKDRSISESGDFCNQLKDNSPACWKYRK